MVQDQSMAEHLPPSSQGRASHGGTSGGLNPSKPALQNLQINLRGECQLASEAKDAG